VSDVNLLRYVPVESPLHRMWAGTKLLAASALIMMIAERPTWIGIALMAALLLGAMAAARIPAGALPRLPRWFWIGIAISGGLTALGGDKPYVTLFGTRLGLGGAEAFTLFTLIFFEVVLTAALLGWTTQMADVGPALRVVLAPLRIVRFPVDEMVLTIGLSLRCLPLLFEEWRVVAAARRMRAQSQTGKRHYVQEGHDLLVTALVSAVRRAREMAEAMDARGGPAPVPRPKVHLHRVDVALTVVVLAALVVMLVV
jgi:energy-coupling factor transporter transmembrane protein EcfT